MAKGDWLVLLGSVVLVLIPAPAHSGELTNEDYAAFAIRPKGSCGDVKTRLWSGVNVAALAPDLSIRCDESYLIRCEVIIHAVCSVAIYLFVH